MPPTSRSRRSGRRSNCRSRFTGSRSSRKRRSHRSIVRRSKRSSLTGKRSNVRRRLTSRSPRRYRSADARALASKFEDPEDVYKIRNLLERHRLDKDEITAFLLRFTREECLDFVTIISDLECIPLGKLQFLLSNNDNLDDILNEATLIDQYHCENKPNEMNDEVEVLDTKGDGACFFRSIRYAETGQDRYRQSNDDITSCDLQQVRDRFVNMVIYHWDTELFGPDTLKLSNLVHFEHGKNTKESYIEYMTDPTTWAGQPEVFVAQYIYGGITVYSRRLSDGRLLAARYGSTEPTTVHTFYNGINHYNAVRKPSVRCL